MSQEPRDHSRRNLLLGGALALTGGWQLVLRRELEATGIKGAMASREVVLTQWWPREPDDECGSALGTGSCSGQSSCSDQIGNGRCRPTHDCTGQTCSTFECAVAECTDLSGGCVGLDVCAGLNGECSLIRCDSHNGECSLRACEGKSGPCSLEEGCTDNYTTELEQMPPGPSDRLAADSALETIASMPFGRSRHMKS